MKLVPDTSKLVPPKQALFNDSKQVDIPLTPGYEIGSKVVLSVFGDTIVFQRVFVDITGSVTAALMLGHAVSLSHAQPKESEGWFEHSQDKWREDVGLSRFELETARRVLRTKGILFEQRRGAPSRLMYWIDFEVLWAAVAVIAESRQANPKSSR